MNNDTMSETLNYIEVEVELPINRPRGRPKQEPKPNPIKPEIMHSV